MAEHKFEHIRVDQFRSEKTFSPPRRDLSGISSRRNRDIHGPKLEKELAEAFAKAHKLITARNPQAQTGAEGVYLEVESAPGGSLPDLNWPSEDIRFGALRVNDSGSETGSLFVPLTAEKFLAEKVTEYARQNTPKNDPRHEDRFAPVELVRAGTIESLWTDKRALPTDGSEQIWWECWCWSDRTQNLVRSAERMNLRVSESRLYFPELEVVPVYASKDEMVHLLQHTDAIEELRRATDNPAFFTTTVRRDQAVWVDDLLARVDGPPENSPVVAILDGGVAREHPLLANTLQVADCLTLNADWGIDDHDTGGHGTNMAGAVLYADLTYLLADQRKLSLEFGLESIKFLPPPGFQSTDPMTYGAITQAAVALSEIEHPERRRVFCMAVTNHDVSGERPTSWSAAVDQICAGAMPADDTDAAGEPPRRLFFTSAGNVPDVSDPDEISDLDEFPIEDPAQAWNALTIGGFTDKIDIAPEDELYGWEGVAKAGDHSPYSRISTDWEQSRCAMKPELVFEAGNRAISEGGRELLAGIDSLSLLTTSRNFLTEPLATFWATSPATAQGAGMAAAIMARHPDLWPETIRALMVHSAEWTPAMRERIEACKGKKSECILLARQFGYGVPRLDRALASAENDVALVAESHIKPFKRERKLDSKGHLVLGQPTFNEVHYYELPWPKKSLEDLADKLVRLKVTLSYFIEPSPGETAPVTPSSYQSYGLRFALKRGNETDVVFRQRVNQLERGEEKLPEADPDPRWTFGSKSVAAGSLHSDVWVGPAAELASRWLIAIYPVSGWWRYRMHLKRYDSRARYSLVVSITADEAQVELYTEISNLIASTISTEIST